MYIRILLIWLLLPVINCHAQSFEWWAQHVHWDGITPWERYIKFTPGYLGPNALPVPRISNGSVDSVNSIGIGANFHYTKGDNTQNIALYGNYCLVKNKIAFDIYWVPVEHFTMTHELKEERNVFSTGYYDRYAVGDIHLNTTIQIFNQPARQLRSAIRIGYRFPTSGGLNAARFTDAPGFWFDVSMSKGLKSLPSLQWITMLGAYFWQSDNIERHRQDDAFLFGTGFEWNKNRTKLQAYISGYFGYFENLRDDPIVVRLNAERTIRRSTLFVRFQQGIHDFKYTSGEIGSKWEIGKRL